MVTHRYIAALALILVTLAVVSDLEADENGDLINVDRGIIINVDYSMGFPLGETRSYTSSWSPQGIGLEVRFRGKHIKGGIGISWQVFSEERQAPGTPSGAKFEQRTTSLVPMLATGYYVRRHGTLHTFVGGGVGAMLDRRKFQAQAEETANSTWYFAASGTAGAVYEITPGFGVETKVRYVGGFKSGYKPVGMVQATLGIIFFY